MLAPHVGHKVEVTGELISGETKTETTTTAPGATTKETTKAPTQQFRVTAIKMVADACTLTGTPLVWGSVLRFDGQVSVFWSAPPAGHGYEPVTYRDVFARPPAPGEVPSCAEAGVLGAVCGVVGTAMAVEVVKLLLGIGDPLLGRVATYDALSAR